MRAGGHRSRRLKTAHIQRSSFDRADFVYHAEKDTYECPAGKWLPYHYTNEQDGKTVWNYWTID